MEQNMEFSTLLQHLKFSDDKLYMVYFDISLKSETVPTQNEHFFCSSIRTTCEVSYTERRDFSSLLVVLYGKQLFT